MKRALFLDVWYGGAQVPPVPVLENLVNSKMGPAGESADWLDVCLSLDSSIYTVHYPHRRKLGLRPAFLAVYLFPIGVPE
jgi:hypothetical protein